MPNWTKEPEFDAEVAPILSKLVEVCRKHRLPVVFTVQYGHDDKGAQVASGLHLIPGMETSHMLLFQGELIKVTRDRDHMAELLEAGAAREKDQAN